MAFGFRRQLIIILVFALALSGGPGAALTALAPHAVAASGDGKPILFEGLGGKGSSPTDPVITGDPRITVTGVVVAPDVNPNDIRFEIVEQPTMNFASVRPEVSGSRFIFRDIPLLPDSNTIRFYLFRGGVRTYLDTLYVRYNDTPLITNIRVDGTPLPPLGTTPAVVREPVTRQEPTIQLPIEGEVRNADRLTITNVTTDKTPISAVIGGNGQFVSQRSVTFTVGANVLTFQAYKGNKEVYYIERTVVVVPMTSDGLLYDAKVGRAPKTRVIALDKEAVTEVPVAIDPSSRLVIDDTGADQDGYALIRGKFIFDGSPYVSQYDKMDYKVYAVNVNTGQRAPAPLHAESGVTLSASPRIFDWSGSLGGLDSQAEWRLEIEYTLIDSASRNAPKSGVIDLLSYTIRFINKDDPLWLSVTDLLTGTPWLKGATYVVTSLPLTLRVEAMNIRKEQFGIEFDGERLQPKGANASGDYEIISWNDSGASYVTFDLKIFRLPQKTGTLKLIYAPDSNNKPPVSADFTLNVYIAPYVALFTPKGTPIDRDVELTAKEEFDGLKGKIYNYRVNIVSDVPTNLRIELNGTPLSGDPANPDFKVTEQKDEYVGWELTQAGVQKVRELLREGINRLVITLPDAPQAVFVYEIRLFGQKLSRIRPGFTLEVIYNNKVMPLKPEPETNIYRTTAMFLSKLSFYVEHPKDGQVLTIQKNGVPIAQYRYTVNDSRWKMIVSDDPQNPDVLKRYVDSLPNELKPYAMPDRYNFHWEYSGDAPFEATLSQNDYKRILKSGASQSDIDRLPLTIRQIGRTSYTVLLTDKEGNLVSMATVEIERIDVGWTIIAPYKDKPTDPYPIVNKNAVEVRLFAEKATEVVVGNVRATTANTTTPDYEFNEAIGQVVPRTYYVFVATVPLKPGLNKLPVTLTIDGKKYKDEILVFNANAPLTGAIFIDTFGKKTTFSAFDKRLNLSFPKGTVLVAPPEKRTGDEYIDQRSPIYVDVPIFIAIADRVTGEVEEPITGPELKLGPIPDNFVYASPLYYIDAGDKTAPGGRDPFAYHAKDERRIGEVAPEIRTFRGRVYDNLLPSRRGTLTLAYDPSVVVQSANQITVYFHDGIKWYNIGGVVDPKKHTVTVPFIRFGYYMVMKLNRSFDDVVGHPYAKLPMETMYAKGIMPNETALTFGAYRIASRGELATALVKALDLPINAGPYEDQAGMIPLKPTFYDVRPSTDTWDYAYRYIETAARAGIVSGKKPGFFRPSDGVTREEAAVMIARAMNLKLPATPEAAQAILAKQFTDVSQMNYYALQAIAAVTKAGLMEGTPADPKAKKTTYTFNPSAPLTRAELAVILQKMMVQMKKLPK
ncbi:MAG: S-layer homology domain-containing protein [Hydrogenibacillus schlegelii]|uniref:S-layer homology domain-containing protein n=1 Tax=Hydrogenibacillus schlegelii TaxID=1484 RepID=A0A947CYY4_HYDSH|nr:S-layer homology domain-containing protein [Hydrogenibacillus schlegelii]